MKRKPVIILFGPDGAGKSTQAKLLTELLKSNNVRARQSWVVSALHSFAFAISKVLVANGFYRVVSNPFGGSYKLVSFRRVPQLKKIWPYIEMLSILPSMFVRVELPSLLGWTVVTERYTLDSVPAQSWLLEDPKFPENRFTQLLLRLIPRNSCLIDLDCNYQTILDRRGKIAEPEKFIRIQRQVYSHLSKQLPVKTLDTSTQSIQETHFLIVDHISKLFPGKTLVTNKNQDKSRELTSEVLERFGLRPQPSKDTQTTKLRRN